jgi:hypothetical protein
VSLLRNVQHCFEEFPLDLPILLVHGCESTYHAQALFIGNARGKSPGQNLPLPDGKTIFEVRLIGEETIYRVLGERVERWANEEARKQHDEVYERVNRRGSRSQRG